MKMKKQRRGAEEPVEEAEEGLGKELPTNERPHPC